MYDSLHFSIAGGQPFMPNFNYVAMLLGIAAGIASYHYLVH